jgi:hypothetical protein
VYSITLALLDSRNCQTFGGPPAKLESFPIFRDGVADPRTGKIVNWWLWDGEREWLVGGLTDEQKKYPIREIVNDTLLMERIESGSTSDDEA